MTAGVTDGPVVEVRVLDERLRAWGLPRYQSAMAAAVDLVACLDAPLSLPPGSPAVLVSTGIALLIGDPGLCGLVVPRSGLGHRAGLVMGNGTGVIDADYTGPVMVSAWNRNAPGTEPVVIAPGDRIAQMLFVPVARARFAEVAAFSRNTARGAGGFGSTGVGGA